MLKLDAYTHVSLDTEFMPNNLTRTGLVSLGLACGEERYYAVNAEMDTAAVLGVPWMVENVWKHLPLKDGLLDTAHPDVKPYETIRDEVDVFFQGVWTGVDGDFDRVRLLVNCGAQDTIRLHTLWDNNWAEMPRWIPHYHDDMKRIRLDSGIEKALLPAQDPATEHHALYDAEHDQGVLNFIRDAVRAASSFGVNA